MHAIAPHPSNQDRLHHALALVAAAERYLQSAQEPVMAGYACALRRRLERAGADLSEAPTTRAQITHRGLDLAIEAAGRHSALGRSAVEDIFRVGLATGIDICISDAAAEGALREITRATANAAAHATVNAHLHSYTGDADIETGLRRLDA